MNNHSDEAKQMVQWRSEARIQENHKLDHKAEGDPDILECRTSSDEDCCSFLPEDEPKGVPRGDKTKAFKGVRTVKRDYYMAIFISCPVSTKTPI